MKTLLGAIATATTSSTPYKLAHPRKTHGKARWTPEVSAAVEASKKAHYMWKEAGRPQGEHPLPLARKKASRTVRRVQRTQAAVERHQILQQISEASENDPKLFHRLIKKQRDNGQGTVSLLIDGRTVTEETEIRESWAKYYENLADPGQPNTERSRMVDYMRILSRLDTTAISVTPDLIRKAITRLNNGKATDRYGVAAEQLKMLTPKALGTLTTIVNKIFQTRRVPDFMKMSYKLPIPKKDKDQRIQDNHRGITIAPIITKVLETVCLESGLSTDIKTNGLQFGFAIGKSPSMATLLVTEAIAEAKANRTPLYIAALDARKAFDVVNHQVLKTKLYNSPICGLLWNMIDDLYTGGNEVIRWNGKYSSPYQVKQGVKQGGILSACLYKLYLYDLLDTLKKSDLGLSIGCTYVGTPTCADDVLHLASTGYELQSMLSFNGLYADKHMYEIHPVKSSVTIMHQPTASPPDVGSWNLHWNGQPPTTDTNQPTAADPEIEEDQTISVTTEFTHLGLDWMSAKGRPDINKNVQKARRAAYSLLITGVHGRNGLDPPYIIPNYSALCHTKTTPGYRGHTPTEKWHLCPGHLLQETPSPDTRTTRKRCHRSYIPPYRQLANWSSSTSKNTLIVWEHMQIRLQRALASDGPATVGNGRW